MVLVQKEVKKVYLGSTQVRPPTGRGALAQNLGIYRPLNSDADDHKLEVGGTGTLYNASWTSTPSYTTVGDKPSAHFSHGYNSGSYVTSSYLRKDIPITIAAWFYSTNDTTWQTILCTQDNYTDGSNNKIWIGLGATNATYSYGVTNGPSYTISTGQRVFVCCSIDSNGNWKGYINNTYDSGTGGLSMTFDKRWQVGNGGSNGFYGNIRDVAIWERALSQSEMLEYRALTI